MLRYFNAPSESVPFRGKTPTFLPTVLARVAQSIHLQLKMKTHRVLKEQEDESLHPSRKSNRSIVSPQLDQEPLWWIRECERWKITITTSARYERKQTEFESD
uniref:AlNc14C145G7354 protein n=1 Tax=Albugo laibachii Nc14 TaxID=890382 RepID=F0WLG7_9STRA|nr:AlNc14C145G7354 [Albugo laibachii Nc14]|eukprot:CCA22130.1 AlNc14C145G7354 [Albugo laibachii Nc14]